MTRAVAPLATSSVMPKKASLSRLMVFLHRQPLSPLPPLANITQDITNPHRQGLSIIERDTRASVYKLHGEAHG